GIARRIRPLREHVVAPPERRLVSAAAERLFTVRSGAALARARLAALATALRGDCTAQQGRPNQRGDDDLNTPAHTQLLSIPIRFIRQLRTGDRALPALRRERRPPQL